MAPPGQGGLFRQPGRLPGSRLTNAFSKKWENHGYHLALYFLFYNFCRAHMTLSKATDDRPSRPTTPAMAAGLADHVWTVQELLTQLATHRSLLPAALTEDWVTTALESNHPIG